MLISQRFQVSHVQCKPNIPFDDTNTFAIHHIDIRERERERDGDVLRLRLIFFFLFMKYDIQKKIYHCFDNAFIVKKDYILGD